MKWFLIVIQVYNYDGLVATGYAREYPTEAACQEQADSVTDPGTAGALANPPEIVACVNQLWVPSPAGNG